MFLSISVFFGAFSLVGFITSWLYSVKITQTLHEKSFLDTKNITTIKDKKRKTNSCKKKTVNKPDMQDPSSIKSMMFKLEIYQTPSCYVRYYLLLHDTHLFRLFCFSPWHFQHSCYEQPITHARIQEFSSGGVQVHPMTVFVVVVFLFIFFSPQLITFKENYHFPRFQGVQHFPGGGGGGGGGCQLLISYRNPYNMIFSRPPPPPPPPLDPPMLQKLLTGTDTVHLLAILLSRGKSIETLFLIFIRDDLDFHCFQNRHLYAHKQRSNNDNNI